MTGGNKTENFIVASLPPNAALGSLPTSVNVKFENFQNLTGWSAKDDHVQLTNSGTPVGSDGATLTPLAIGADNNVIYSFSLAGTGITLVDINAGNVGVQYGATIYPVDPNTFDVGNWDITITPTSPVIDFSSLVLDVTTGFVIAAHWKFATNLAPDRILLTITTGASATGRAHNGVGTLNFSGTCSVDDGQGDTDSGSIQAPTTGSPPTIRSVTGTNTYVIDLTNGDGQKTITCHSTTNLTTAALNTGLITHTCSAVIAAQPSVTIDVDSTQSSYNTATMVGIANEMERIPKSVGVRTL